MIRRRVQSQSSNRPRRVDPASTRPRGGSSLLPGKYAYWSTYKNFGDRFTPLLLRHILGTNVSRVDRRGEAPSFWIIGVGSILDHRSLDRSSVWGTGVVKAGAVLRGTPRAVHAVRGPLTADWLARRGVHLSDQVVFGDPGLLLPRLLPNRAPKRYRLAIIPHLVDLQHPWVRAAAATDGAVVVDLSRPVAHVAATIASAESAISSSLHGLITADAYGVPSAWVEFSDKVWGNGFKFRDYYQALGIAPGEPLRITPRTSIDECLTRVSVKPVPQECLDAIEACCPRFPRS